MAKLLILFVFLLQAKAYGSPIFIVTDLDDTLKVTNVKNPVEALRNALFSRKVFTGVPLLLKSMQSYALKTFILTASPKIFSSNIFKLIEQYHLNIDHVYMRGLRDANKYQYKFDVVEELIRSSKAKFILIGDNTSFDDDVYQDIQKKYPDRVLAIYIHKVTNDPKLANQKSWVTVSDIAAYEVISGRMSFTSAQDILDEVSNESLDKVIPDFVYCPRSSTFWSYLTYEEFERFFVELNNKILSYCQE